MQLSLLDWQQKPAAPTKSAAAEWTPKEIGRLVELYIEYDYPDVAEIAQRLGKTYAQVASMASRMGLSFTRRGEDAKLRRCLPCGKDFWSESRSNRICMTCKRSKDYMECAYA
jgi:hypothetical protein